MQDDNEFDEIEHDFWRRTATAILTFLILFGLVLFIFIRYRLVAAIGFAAAIILGRKAVKYIISEKGLTKPAGGETTPHTLTMPPNKRVEASVNSPASS